MNLDNQIFYGIKNLDNHQKNAVLDYVKHLTVNSSVNVANKRRAMREIRAALKNY